ncbi:MAG: acyltransferase [Paramuribaculum sp.]|nr:acyltransferase [Paramuribaculum sp.]
MEILEKTFFQLIIPFISWAMLGMVMDGTFSFNWLTKPDDGLWFLWVLFWIGAISICLSKLTKLFNWPEELIVGICCTILLGVLLINKLSFGYHLVAWYLPFYSLGALTNKYEEKFDDVLIHLKWFLLVLFIVLGLFWMRTLPPAFIGGNSMLITYVYKFITGIVACFGIYIAAKSLNRKLSVLSEIGGGMTLGIYAIHQPLIRFLREFIFYDFNLIPIWVQVILLFFISILLTVTIYWVISKNKYTSKLFLGK